MDLREQSRYYEDRAPEYDDVWYRRGIYDLGPEANRRWFQETAKLEAALDDFAPSGGCSSRPPGRACSRVTSPRTRRG